MNTSPHIVESMPIILCLFNCYLSIILCLSLLSTVNLSYSRSLESSSLKLQDPKRREADNSPSAQRVTVASTTRKPQPSESASSYPHLYKAHMQWVQVDRKFSPTVSISSIPTFVSYLRPNLKPCSSGSDKRKRGRQLAGHCQELLSLMSASFQAFIIFLDLSTHNFVSTVQAWAFRPDHLQISSRLVSPLSPGE